MFSTAVSDGMRLYSWNTMPMRVRRNRTHSRLDRIGRPSQMT